MEQSNLNPNQNQEKIADKTRDKKKTMVTVAFLVLGGVIAGYFIGVEAGFNYIVPYVYKKKDEKFFKDFAKPYMEDFIGGNTPEETIDMFIEALKKEDYDLAVKYFEIQEQPRWIESFKNPNKKNIEEWIKELEDNKKSWHKEQISDSNFVFKYNTGIGNDEITNFIYIRKNINNKWKIESF